MRLLPHSNRVNQNHVMWDDAATDATEPAGSTPEGELTGKPCFGCMYAEAVGCKVCGCWVQSIWRRLGACMRLLGASMRKRLGACMRLLGASFITAGSLPDNR